MNAEIRAVMDECTHASDDERISFPEVVARLMRSGVERYHADLIRAEKIYYMPNGESHRTPCKAVTCEAPGGFSAARVESAVRAIQRKEIGYHEFCERIAAAGCVGYVVSLAGGRAVYYGRTFDTYVEPFPAMN